MAWVGTDDDVRLEAVHGTWSDRTRVTRSLLMIAAEKGHFMLTEALLRRGAKPNWQSCDGHSALTLAVTGTCERREQGRSKVVRALTPCPRTRLLLSRPARSAVAPTSCRRARPLQAHRVRLARRNRRPCSSAAVSSLASPPSVADAASEDEALLSRPT